MLPDRVSNQAPLTYESGALPTPLRSQPPLPPQTTTKKSVSFSLEGKPHPTAELPKTKIFVVILEAEGPVLWPDKYMLKLIG